LIKIRTYLQPNHPSFTAIHYPERCNLAENESVFSDSGLLRSRFALFVNGLTVWAFPELNNFKHLDDRAWAEIVNDDRE